MKRIWLTAMLTLAVWLAPAVRAELVSQDYLAPGDGLLTLDSQTGLRWLDVSATQGLSANQILAGAGGWNSHFRYATYAELSTLFEHAGLPNLAGPDGATRALSTAEANALYPFARDFNLLLNTAAPVSTSGIYIWDSNSISYAGVIISGPAIKAAPAPKDAGFTPKDAMPGSAPGSKEAVDTPVVYDRGYSYIHQYLNPAVLNESYDFDWSHPSYGSMLVLAVPEPQTWALLLAGFGLLAGVARRRVA